MSIFKKLFSGSNEDSNAKNEKQGNSSNGKSVYLGRYTDSNKNTYQLDAFNNAKNAFKEQKYFESFKHFLEYLGDKTIQNVSYSINGEELTFEIIQGSKIIKGSADDKFFTAEAKVVIFEGNLSIAVMRKLMMMNYNLKYGMFAINENEVVLKFKSSSRDASPNKLYAGLKEIATYADKQDDLLVDEFPNLKSVDQHHINEIPEEHKEVKYKYLHKWISETIERVDKLDEAKFSGAISFALLALAYKVDYMLTPEGVLTNALEKVQGVYSRKDLDIVQRNFEMKKEFGKILEIPKEDIYKSFYTVKATFGIVTPVNFKQVSDFIFEETKKVGSYLHNNELDTVEDIYGYIAGYCLFYWGMFNPLKELIAFYLHIMNADYFNELGMGELYIDSSGSINKNLVKSEILRIVDRGKKEYPKLYFNTNYLKFTSNTDFAASFYKEIDVLIFTK